MTRPVIRTRTIPETVQRPWRERLRLLRQHAGKKLSSFDSVGGGTIGTYENHDISTMTLGVAVGIASELGYTLNEFMNLLCGNEEDLELVDRSVERAIATFQLLHQQNKELATALLNSLYAHQNVHPPVVAPPPQGNTIPALIARVQRSNTLRNDLARLDRALNP